MRADLPLPATPRRRALHLPKRRTRQVRALHQLAKTGSGQQRVLTKTGLSRFLAIGRFLRVDLCRLANHSSNLDSNKIHVHVLARLLDLIGGQPLAGRGAAAF
jgi:hypothetical protein